MRARIDNTRQRTLGKRHTARRCIHTRTQRNAHTPTRAHFMSALTHAGSMHAHQPTLVGELKDMILCAVMWPAKTKRTSPEACTRGCEHTYAPYAAAIMIRPTTLSNPRPICISPGENKCAPQSTQHTRYCTYRVPLAVAAWEILPIACPAPALHLTIIQASHEDLIEATKGGRASAILLWIALPPPKYPSDLGQTLASQSIKSPSTITNLRSDSCIDLVTSSALLERLALMVQGCAREDRAYLRPRVPANNKYA